MSSILVTTFLAIIVIIVASLGLLRINEKFAAYHYKSLYEIQEPIDIVYTWVDGDDTEWLTEKNLYKGVSIKDASTVNRFKNRDEIKYSLRSLDMFAPWIRNIFIVTYSKDSYPSWLDINNERVHIISHSDIFTDKSHLPTFNSQAIECHLYNIPGLSERFIYSNDDTMFGSRVNKQDFIDRDGKLKYGYGKGMISSWKNPKYNGLFFDSWINNSKILDNTFGEDSKRIEIPHQLCIMDKKYMKFIYDNFPEEIEKTSKSRFRGEDNIAPIGLAIFCALAMDKAKRKDISNIVLKLTDSFINTKIQMNKVNNSHPKLLCVNDDTKEPSLEIENLLNNFFQSYFPLKSSFEL